MILFLFWYIIDTRMTRCNTLNVKLSNSQLSKLKSAIKNGTEVTLNLSSNIIGDSNDENDFSPKLLLTNTHVSRPRKTFANNSSANMKLSKTQLHKIGRSEWFSGRFLGPLLKSELPLLGNVPKTLAKSVLIPLGLTAAASTTDAAIHNKMFGSGFTTLIISNEEMEDIMKIVKSLEESGLSIKDVSKTIKNEAKEQKGWFLEMLLETLGARLLGNLSTGKVTIRVGEGTIRAGENF